MTLAAKGIGALKRLVKRGDDGDFPVAALTANGSLRLTEQHTVITLTKATALALTLVIPRAGISFYIHHLGGVGIEHTVTLPAGMTWEGTNDVATLNAVGDSMLCYVISPTRILVAVNNGAVAFS